jgi:cysteinyl-tRNA synthetase
VSLRIYNTLTRQKEPFTPREPAEAGALARVSMYVCGVTPYDLSHVGHARSAIVFDVIRRYLRHRGFEVTFVKNFTDVEDKIINRAAKLGCTPEELARRFVETYRQEMANLDVLRPNEEPLATAHILPAPGKPYRMVSLIERLVAGGFAYPAGGDVYFEVQRFPGYGRLSRKNLDELVAGARVEVDARKRDPRDFALWKSAKPGEPSWPSPWGPGRPGWHIECSAMAMEHLGETIDLHGGGEDLIFPHHECEIAQSEAATGKPFARYWLHNGFVNLGAEKMSKSLGNVMTIEALLQRHDAEAVKYYLLQTHYRGPVEFTEAGVTAVGPPLERIRDLIEETGPLFPGDPEREATPGFLDRVASFDGRFQTAMDDDFNTPQALGVLNELVRMLNVERDLVRRGARTGHDLKIGVQTLTRLGRVLGLKMEGQTVRLEEMYEPEWRQWVETKIGERERARKDRDWARADRLRAELDAQGVALKDGPTGTTWTRKAAATQT